MNLSTFSNEKLDTDGCGYLRHVARQNEFPGFGLDTKGHDRVRILVGGKQESPCRVNPEMARGFSPGRFMSHARESSGGRVNPEAYNAVVTPV